MNDKPEINRKETLKRILGEEGLNHLEWLRCFIESPDILEDQFDGEDCEETDKILNDLKEIASLDIREEDLSELWLDYEVDPKPFGLYNVGFIGEKADDYKYDPIKIKKLNNDADAFWDGHIKAVVSNIKDEVGFFVDKAANDFYQHGDYFPFYIHWNEYKYKEGVEGFKHIEDDLYEMGVLEFALSKFEDKRKSGLKMNEDVVKSLKDELNKMKNSLSVRFATEDKKRLKEFHLEELLCYLKIIGNEFEDFNKWYNTEFKKQNGGNNK